MKIQGHIIIRRKPKNGDNGQDAVLYELMPSGQIINFSNDNVFSPSFVTCSIKKIQGSNLIMLTTASALSTEGLRLSYAMDDGSDGDTVINPTTKVYPNDKISYINFILKKNEVIIDKKTIQICNDGKDGEKGEDGLQGCILRQSEWVSGVEYRNDEALISGTRYLDIAIVTTGANTFNAYKCLKTHTSSDSIPVTNTTYWQKFNSLVPVYTPLIMAQNAILRFMQGNQLLIMKGDNKTVAAGLVGGDYPLWVGATTPTDAPYKVSIAGKLYAAGAVISGDSTFEGTLKGVSGSFTRLNCVNAAGDAVGGISFGSDGRMWFDGDMYHQGTKDNRSLRFYTSDLWCRGVFGARERSIMVVYGSYAYVYTKGADKTGTYIPLTSGTSSANETYYTVPCYSPRYDYNGETSGFPVDTVIFRITSNVTYRYLLSLAVTQRIFVVNANDNYNNVQIYANGTKQTLNGGSMHHCMQLVDFMYPSPNSDWLGRGLMFGASNDNDWK